MLIQLIQQKSIRIQQEKGNLIQQQLKKTKHIMKKLKSQHKSSQSHKMVQKRSQVLSKML
jgi:hypothetical protein